jgi:hypothetical protein
MAGSGMPGRTSRSSIIWNCAFFSPGSSWLASFPPTFHRANGKAIGVTPRTRTQGAAHEPTDTRGTQSEGLGGPTRVRMQVSDNKV